MKNLGGSLGRALLLARNGRLSSKQMNELRKCGNDFMPENQKHTDNAGERRGDGHYLVGPGIEGDQLKTHELSLLRC
jgi:hypothetical protein